MSTRTTGSERQPLGGTNGSWRHRLMRFHLPIALGSALLFLVFMTVPLFDPLAYQRMDMSGGSALPQPMAMNGDATMPPDASGQPGHGGNATQLPSGRSGGGTPPPADHSSNPAAPASGHGSGSTSGTGHAGNTGGSSESRDASASREQSRFTQRVTVATGYVATGLLAITLLVGPMNLLLRRRDPISSYLRRDVGMWTAGFAVVHVVFGLQVHSAGQLAAVFAYFFRPDGSLLVSSFGLGNWTGLIATVIVIGLLTISSDLALRTLKAPTWKVLQRLNYALFAVVVAHAVFYGALLRATSPFTLILTLAVTAVLVGQLVGITLMRRRLNRRSI